MDESQLIIACKKQDRNAQRVLYNRYAPTMYAVCLRYCKEEETAHDLLHDGFIRAFTQIGSYKGKGSFEGWLRRIFVNLALEDYRKKKQYLRFLEEYGVHKVTEQEMLKDDPLEIEGVSREDLMQMIRDLPTGYRTVFNLLIFENMTHREVAEKLGIQEAASRSQFFRAKNLLRKRISAALNQLKKKK